MAWTAIQAGAWAIVALATVGAAAQTTDRAATTPPPPSQNKQLYSYSMRNLGTRAIEQATAHMTNGATADITANGRIMPNEAQSFGANNGGCLASLSVRFAGGATLDSDHISDCNVSSIVVRDDKIDLNTSASRKMAPPTEPSDR